MKRDYSVELLRIIGCFLVIGTHIKLSQYFIDGEIYNSLVLIADLFAEGVGIFFLILGFFYFNNLSFIKMLKRLFFKILIPVVFYVIFIVTFINLKNFGENSFETIINNNIQTYISIFKGLLSWGIHGVPHTNHLWYIFTYIQCILFFPLVGLLKGDNNKKKRLYIIAVGIVAVIFNDIKNFIHPDISISLFNILPVSMIIVLLGNELYSRKDILKRKYVPIFFIALYIFAKTAAYFLVCRFITEDNRSYVFNWQTFFQILSALSIGGAVLGINIKNEKLQNIISFLGGCTFSIYIIHLFVISILDSLNVRNFILDNTSKLFGFASEFIYTVSYAAIIFIVSLIFTLIIRAAKNIILRGLRYGKSKT